VDQPGFYLLPTVVSTYAPVGQTPILHERLVRDHLSVISAITLEGKLLMMEQEKRAFKSPDVVRFLRHLLRQIPGKCSSSGMVRRSIAAGRSKSSSPAGRRIGLSWSSFPSLRS
jgi:hypothetical protein